jgi:hypothetical protein
MLNINFRLSNESVAFSCQIKVQFFVASSKSVVL